MAIKSCIAYVNLCSDDKWILLGCTFVGKFMYCSLLNYSGVVNDMICRLATISVVTRFVNKGGIFFHLFLILCSPTRQVYKKYN